MRYCVNCRTPLYEESTCLVCGTPADVTVVVPVQSSSGPIPENIASALCYLGLVVSGLVMLLWPAYRGNRTVRFHAVQSILLTPTAMVLYLSLGMYASEDRRDQVMFAFQVGFLALWFFLMAMSYLGRKVSLPLLGALTDKELGTMR
jgi:uncharacterized membrane protein